MTSLAIRILFLHGSHVGEPGIGIENFSTVAHSDTIFGGICHAWREIYGRDSLEDMLSRFPRNGDEDKIAPFCLSSGFPFVDGHYFMPRPLLPIMTDPITIPDPLVMSETMKDVRYVEAALLTKWIHGHHMDADDLKAMGEYKKLLNEAITERLIPGNELNRVTNQSTIYHRGAAFFRDGAGLFFLLRSEDESMSGKIMSCLMCLQHNGLGGERSIGLGTFSLEVDHSSILSEPLGDEGGYCLLSLYNPTRSEAQRFTEDLLYGYEVIQRGGWASSPDFEKGVRLLPLKFFKEGSVFKETTRPQGRIVNANPWGETPHPVYKYGIAFPVKVSRKAFEPTPYKV